MLLAGLVLAKTLIPWSGPVFTSRHRTVRNRCVIAWCKGVCRILHLEISRQGRPCLEAGLSVANHISWIDILALATERDLVFVAKHEVSMWPLMGPIFKGIGTIFIRRGHKEATMATADQMREHLEHGIALMLFPEATTTDGNDVRRFGGKLLEPAIETSTLIQPVALRYTGQARYDAPFIGDDTFVAHLIRILQQPKIRLTIAYGDPIHASLHPKEALSRTLRQTVIGLIAESPHEAPDGLLRNRHTSFTPLSH